MPFNDFREFLTALRADGELLDVDRLVALELEVAEAMRGGKRRVGVSAVSASALVIRRWAVASRDFGTSRGFRTFRYPFGAFASLLILSPANSHRHPNGGGRDKEKVVCP